MPSFRLERIANIISLEISKLILSGAIKDYRVSSALCVSHVEVSSDIAYAKVWISTMGDSSKLPKAVEGMNSASGFIQSVLGKKLQTRYTPKLHFIEDHSVESAIKIQNKIDEVMENASK